MSNKITVTGKTGPGITETAQVYNNVTNLNFNYGAGVLFITYNSPNSKVAEVELSTLATLTYTISGGSATIVAST